jgi:hypothetical protein
MCLLYLDAEVGDWTAVVSASLGGTLVSSGVMVAILKRRISGTLVKMKKEDREEIKEERGRRTKARRELGRHLHCM